MLRGIKDHHCSVDLLKGIKDSQHCVARTYCTGSRTPNGIQVGPLLRGIKDSWCYFARPPIEWVQRQRMLRR